MENFHYLNGVKCLQLAHDCAHVIFPQTLKIQYGGPQAINSMRMSGTWQWHFAPIKSVPLWLSGTASH